MAELEKVGGWERTKQLIPELQTYDVYLINSELDRRFYIGYAKSLEAAREIWYGISQVEGVCDLMGFAVFRGKNLVYFGDYSTDEC